MLKDHLKRARSVMPGHLENSLLQTLQDLFPFPRVLDVGDKGVSLVD